MILVDDGSPDQCGEICDAYEMRDARVRVIHKTNGGVSSARNTGIDVACGAYCIFVDSDDYVHKDYLRKLYEQPGDLVLCGIETQDENQKVLSINIPQPMFFSCRQDINYVSLYEKQMLYSPYCKKFRMDIIHNKGIRFPREITWGEDGMFVADYLKHVGSITSVSYVGYYYIKYKKEESLSTKIRADIIEMITTSREHCIEMMKKTSIGDYEEVKKVCQKDIKQNCAFFIEKLLRNTNMQFEEKAQLLNQFMRNEYVKAIIENPCEVYGDKTEIVESFSLKTAEQILEHYKPLSGKRKQSIKQNIYKFLPNGIKRAYCRIKWEMQK